jgi:hypothetical protein
MLLIPSVLGLLVWLIRRPWPNWLQVRAGIPPVQGFHRDGVSRPNCRGIHW